MHINGMCSTAENLRLRSYSTLNILCIKHKIKHKLREKQNEHFFQAFKSINAKKKFRKTELNVKS